MVVVLAAAGPRRLSDLIPAQDEVTAEERLLAEQLVLNMRVLNRVCRAAPDGHVLDVAERLALEQGRELTRRMLEVSLQSEGAEVEKKGVPCGSAPAG